MTSVKPFLQTKEGEFGYISDKNFDELDTGKYEFNDKIIGVIAFNKEDEILNIVSVGVSKHTEDRTKKARKIVRSTIKKFSIDKCTFRMRDTEKNLELAKLLDWNRSDLDEDSTSLWFTEYSDG